MMIPQLVEGSDSSASQSLFPDDSSPLSDLNRTPSDAESTKVYVSDTLERKFERFLEASTLGNGLPATNNDDEAIKLLHMKLQLEKLSSTNLESEIQRLRGSFNKVLNFDYLKFRHQGQSMTMENNCVTTFEDRWPLSSDSNESVGVYDAENFVLANSKSDSESLVVNGGRYDTEMLFHAMATRIETLIRENQDINKMLEYGKKKEMQIQLLLSQIEKGS